MSSFGRLTLVLTGFLAGLSHAGSDCSLARDEISRDACYKANADEHWRNSRSYQRIQEYNQSQSSQSAAQRTPLDERWEKIKAENRARAEAEREEEARQNNKTSMEEFLRMGEIARANIEAARRLKEKLAEGRSRTLQRVENEVLRLQAVGDISEADYDRLITLSVPEWDLMRRWAQAALEKYPKQFALRAAVVDMVGCDYASYADHFNLHRQCSFNIDSSIAAMAALPLPNEPLDRALTCGYRWLALGNFDNRMYADYSPKLWSEIRDSYAGKDGLKRNQEQEEKMLKLAQVCEQEMGAAATNLHATLFAHMWRHSDRLSWHPKHPTRGKEYFERWYLVSHTTWGELPDLGNAEVVNRAIKASQERTQREIDY